jgi:hypothetical protein
MSDNDSLKLSDLIDDYEGTDTHGSGSMKTPEGALAAIATKTEEVTNMEVNTTTDTVDTVEATKEVVTPVVDTNIDSTVVDETDKVDVAGPTDKTEEDDDGKVAPVAKTVPAKKKEVVVIPGMIDLHSYMGNNKDKVVNAKLINLEISTVPTGKYLMYVSNEEKDASLIKIDTPDKLQILKPEDAVSIHVYNSGLAIVTATQRIYTRKSNCVMFDLDSTGHPIAMRTITKKGSATPVTETAAEEKYVDTDDLKLLLKKQAVTLFNKNCKDKATIAEIIPEVNTFRPTCTDVEYQIKLDLILMHTKR